MNSYKKRQVLMFYRLGKKTQKRGGGKNHPPPPPRPSTLNNVRPRVKNVLTLASLEFCHVGCHRHVWHKLSNRPSIPNCSLITGAFFTLA